MPMQPRPMAETRGPFGPSVRCCIVNLLRTTVLGRPLTESVHGQKLMLIPRSGVRVHSYQGPAILLAGAMAFSACSGSHQDADATVGVAPSQSAGNLQVLESAAFGFRIAYPKDWTARRDFRSSYLANGSWKTYAPPGSRGTPVAALAVPGSNHVTEAEMRIAVSRAPEEVRSCS